MKKPIIIIIVFVQLLVLCQPIGGEFKSCEARITFIKGRAEVMRMNGIVWAVASIAQRLYGGDKISTIDNSEAEIVLDDGSLLRLKDKTLLEIQRMEKQRRPQATITALKATQGKVLGCIRKMASKESKFTVSTPTAVAGIRGTVFGVFVEGDTTELDVLKGEVGIAGAQGAEVTVGERMTTTVARGDSARKPVMMTAAKIAFIAAWAGAAVKIGSLGAAAATAWYATTPALIGGAAAAAAVATTVVIVATKRENPPLPPASKPTIPAPPGWPQ
jgi:hypothetical protein